MNESESTSKVFTEEALAQLRSYHWPGNVRELKNVVHHAFIMADEAIDTQVLPLEGRRIEPASGRGSSIRVGITVAEAERRLILATLDHFGGRKAEAAGALGISLKTLYNRLRAYEAESALQIPSVEDAGTTPQNSPGNS